MKRILSMVLCVTMALSLLPASALTAGPVETPGKSLADYPDLLFGVGSATSAGPTLPGGSIHPSPETKSKDNGGYSRNSPIVGFGQLYAQGTGGTKSYGNFLLAPMLGGNIELNDSNRAVQAKAGTETAKCYEYSVELENGIKAAVTPTHNAAIYSFEFPAGKDASFLLDAARKQDKSNAMKKGSVTVDPETHTISGGGTFSGNWNPANWNMYFALEFDTDFTEIGAFEDSTLTTYTEKTTVSIDSEKRLGAYVKFAQSATEAEPEPLTVKVKLAISFESEEKAKEFLDEQIPAYDYDAVRDEAKSVWEDRLDAIEIETSDEALLRQFYTALYHTNVEPRDRVSDHGDWDDFYTIWDSWKTAFPLKTFFYPEQVGSIIASFIDRAERNETIIMSDAFIQGQEFVCGQGGNDIENIIADACLKDIPLPEGYDWERAYSAVIKSAERMRTPEYVTKGYAVEGQRKTVSGASYSTRLHAGSATQGFAINDFAVAQMAQKLGKTEDYEFYLNRSMNWRNAWNPNVESDGFYGFPQNPNSDGTFAAGYNPKKPSYNTNFYEATGWDSCFTNRNDMPGLIEAMGGRQKFIERLQWACDHSRNYGNDDGGAEGYLNFTNEPSMHIPWLFCTDEVKRPDLAAETINRILTERFLKDGINDYPGDEDGGAMSSYLIFMLSGFFPYSPTNDYYLHGARLPRITFRLGNGKSFVITGENTGGNNIYVQSATWQGQDFNECKLTYEQIMEGGELHFVMGSEPSRWARMEDNTPPTDVTGLTYDAESAVGGKTVLTWNASADEGEGVARYDVYRSDKIVFECNEEAFVGSVTQTTFEEMPEVPTRYWYRVVAVDGAENRANAAEVCVSLSYDSEPPEQVTGLRVDGALLDNGIVKLSWTESHDNVGVTSYNVYRSNHADFTISSDTLLTAVQSPAITDFLSAAGTYYYRVTARDAYGNISEPSDCVAAEVAGGLPDDMEATPGVNQAKGKTAKVNGQTNIDKEGADKAVDGSISTKWCVKSTGSNGGTGEVAAGTPLNKPHWLEIDLVKPTLLNRWVVTHAGGGSPAEGKGYNTQEFKLQYWNGTAWADADVVTGNKDNVTDRTFSTVITTKVRMEITRAVQDNCTENNKVQTARIYEVELYSPKLESEYDGSLMELSGVKLAVNSQAADAEGPAKACDGDENTKWSARFQMADKTVEAPEGAEAFADGVSWMSIDLGEVCVVDRLTYLGGGKEKPEFRTKELYLQASADGVNWTYTKEGAWKDGDEQVPTKLEYSFQESITSRYFRLVLPVRGVSDGERGNTNARVFEFHLFGEKLVNENKITIAPADGANVRTSKTNAAPGDKIDVDVEYTRADREFVKLLVTGESGTPVPVAQYGEMLKFNFTMPNEPVKIKVYSRFVVDADREALQVALYALKDGEITVAADADTNEIEREVRAYVARLLAGAPGAAGVTAAIEETETFGTFKVTLEKNGIMVVKNLTMTLSGYRYKISGVAGVSGVTVPYGTAKDELGLPGRVKVTFREGGEKEVAVTWDCAEFIKDRAGAYHFIGTIATGEDYANPEELTASCEVTVSHAPSYSTGNTTTRTEKNPDGSTTATVTNKTTGLVTETTTYPDGTKIVATTPKGGESSIKVMVPKGKDSVTITIPTGEILTSGTVAVIVNEDGSEEVVKTSVATSWGLRITLAEGATLKLVDNSKGFADMAEDNWAYDAVQFAASRELFNGTGADSFNPTGDMTRAMLVTVLARLDGQDTGGGETWYSKAVAWGMENGITDGTNAEMSITRESLVVMLYRYAKAEPSDVTALHEFPDADKVSGWAAEAMNWAVANGILTGNGAGELNPGGNASRAEVAAILQRFISL